MSTQAVRSTQPYHTTTSFFCIVVARQENGLTSQSGPEWALLPPVFCVCVCVTRMCSSVYSVCPSVS